MDMISAIIAITVGLILIATLGIAGLNMYFAANTSAFDSSTVAIWGVIGILAVVAMFLVVLPYLRKK